MQGFSDIDPVRIGFTPAKVLSVSPLCSWGRGLSSEAGPHQPRAPIRVSARRSGGLGSLSPVEGPRQWWLPAPAQAVLGSPAPLPASLCVHSEECTQPKFLRDLFLLAGKGRDEAGRPCPQPRKRQRNLVSPSWSSPGVYHTWDPSSGAGVLGACCRETLSL